MAERIEDLFVAAGAVSVVVGEGGHTLVAGFPSERPLDLVDRVEGWLTLVHGEEAVLETATEEAGPWEAGWRAVYRGAEVGERFMVRPPWVAATERLEVVLDPRGAFGSGLHPTTRMALMLMEDRVGPGGLLDVGAGSGVLSVAAARLGASVTALEINASAREACRGTALLNGVAVVVEERSLEAIAASGAQFSQVVANVPGVVLLRVAAALRAVCAPGALLVLAGWRPREAAAIEAAFPGVVVGSLTGEGFAAVAVRTEGTERH